jgi:hypothetical protein
MFYRAFIFLFINVCLFSQQGILFKTPPPNLTLPALLTEEEGTPKNAGLGNIESKWVTSTSETGENLLHSFTTGPEGINQIIKSILLNANVPEVKISQIKVSFVSSGIDELSVDKNSVFFKDDFQSKYEEEKMFLITKLYRTKNVKIELTDEHSENIDPAVSSAISDGLRYGNKTESNLGNKMTIEIPYMMYGYEKIPFSVIKVSDSRVTVILGVLTDMSLNSIKTLKALEGKPGDYFMRVGSELMQQPAEFNVSTENRKHSFRLGNSELYSLTLFENSGNKVTFSISGFKINFDQ